MGAGLFELRKDAITSWWVATIVDRTFARERFIERDDFRPVEFSSHESEEMTLSIPGTARTVIAVASIGHTRGIRSSPRHPMDRRSCMWQTGVSSFAGSTSLWRTRFAGLRGRYRRRSSPRTAVGSSGAASTNGG